MLLDASRPTPLTVTGEEAPADPASTVTGENDVTFATYNSPLPTLTNVALDPATKLTHTEYDAALKPTPLGRLTSNCVFPDPPIFATALAPIVGETQLVPTANITLRMLLTESSPSPLTVREVDAPEDPASTVTGENDTTLETYSSPLTALTKVVFDPATKLTHTEYDEAARPLTLGKLTLNSVFPDPATFDTELAAIIGKVQLVPTANITLRMLSVASSPTPLTVITLDAPPDPASTLTGENDVTFPTYKSPLPALTNVVFDPATKLTHTEYDAGLNPTPLGKLTCNRVPLDPPTFATLLAPIVGDVQLVPTANITLRTLLVASSPSPVTVREVDTPADPASTVTGENDTTLETYNSPLPALTNDKIGPATKLTHTVYDPALNPTLLGKLTATEVPFDPPTFEYPLGVANGDAQLGPSANATLRMLYVESKPEPVTVTTVDAPADPASTVTGENDTTLETYSSPLPALTNVAFDPATKLTHTEYDAALKPTPLGRLTCNSVFPDPPTFDTELAAIVGAAQLVPTANITLRTLLLASRPNPLTVNGVDAPPDPARTVTGENDVTFAASNCTLPALTNVVFNPAA